MLGGAGGSTGRGPGPGPPSLDTESMLPPPEEPRPMVLGREGWGRLERHMRISCRDSLQILLTARPWAPWRDLIWGPGSGSPGRTAGRQLIPDLTRWPIGLFTPDAPEGVRQLLKDQGPQAGEPGRTQPAAPGTCGPCSEWGTRGGRGGRPGNAWAGAVPSSGVSGATAGDDWEASSLLGDLPVRPRRVHSPLHLSGSVSSSGRDHACDRALGSGRICRSQPRWAERATGKVPCSVTVLHTPI